MSNDIKSRLTPNAFESVALHHAFQRLTHKEPLSHGNCILDQEREFVACDDILLAFAVFFTVKFHKMPSKPTIKYLYSKICNLHSTRGKVINLLFLNFAVIHC